MVVYKDVYRNSTKDSSWINENPEIYPVRSAHETTLTDRENEEYSFHGVTVQEFQHCLEK